ncbi:MAG: alcohol dehydrogenase catalytic domain-containing protein, partial [Acidimicrobiales bacterium]
QETAAVARYNRAAVLYGAGGLGAQERLVPQPGERGVLGQVRSVGICGSDLPYYEHGRIGDFGVKASLVLGQEPSGAVLEAGPGASEHSLGQWVATERGVPCGVCRECRSGHYDLCPYAAFFGTLPVEGALAEYVTTREDFAYVLPQSASDDAGALLEAFSAGLWAWEKANACANAQVAVAGAGPIGAVLTLVAQAGGIAEVVVRDPWVARGQRALDLGATAAVDPAVTSLADAASGAEVFFDCLGSPKVVEDGINALRPKGTAVLIGMSPEPVSPLPLARVQTREIWLTGTFRYANTYPRAVTLAASGAIDLDGLVDARFTLEESEQALTASRRDPAVLKPLVRVSAP